MSEETTEGKGVTIKELKNFLASLPKEFDNFGMVNGEYAGTEDDGFYVRLDKPITHLEIDEKTGEFLLLNQSAEEVNTIIDIITKTDGDSKGNK